MSSTKQTMNDLRGHLFDTIEKLKKDKDPMEVNTANAVCRAAGRLIQTAEVEIKYHTLVARSNDYKPSKFLTNQS